MEKMVSREVEEFLRESNAIEGVYDEQSFDDAVWAWGFLQGQSKHGMNPYLVMQIHEILMRNPGAWSEPQLLPKYRGVLRDCPVYIGGHEAMKCEDIEKELEDWCAEMNGTGGEEQSKWLHVQYEKIHPFIDGNGRTGRMFMNWFRLRNNMPLLIIHTGPEQMAYYKWFREYDV